MLDALQGNQVTSKPLQSKPTQRGIECPDPVWFKVELDEEWPELLSPRDKRIDKEMKQQEGATQHLTQAMGSMDQMVAECIEGLILPRLAQLDESTLHLEESRDHIKPILEVLASRLSSLEARAAPQRPEHERTVGDPDGKRRVALCASGSVASVKVPQIVQKLVDQGVHVDVLLTKAMQHLPHMHPMSTHIYA